VYVIQHVSSGGPKEACIRRDAHWCSFANTIESSVCVSAAMQPACEITLTTCHCYIYSAVLLLRVLLTLDVGVIKQHALSYSPFTRYNRLYNPVWQPCWTNSYCSFNRLSNQVVQPVWQPAVYTIQPFVKPVVKRVWQPVECLYTWYNQLSNQFDNGFDNRLHRVYKRLPGCHTGLTTGCIM